tara:strand:- start:4115 stop:4714 length:600 start_codon:yes stop_codon:yes gene_type:complete
MALLPVVMRPLLRKIITPFRPKFLGKLSIQSILGEGLSAMNQGVISAFTREYATRGHGTLTRLRLQTKYPFLPPPVIDQLELRAEMSREAAQLFPRKPPVRGNPFQIPPVIEPTPTYISQQGGRVNVQVEIDIFDPKTGEAYTISHDFIFTEYPGSDLLDSLVQSFITRLCDSPKFAEQYCDGPYADYDYTVTGIDPSY